MAGTMPSEQRSATRERRRSRPVLRLATAAGIALSPVTLAGSAAASEGGEESCPVVASAQGVQVMVSASDNILLQAPTGAAVPAAQTCVDYQIADSSGFAGNPYPGETVLAAPAIVRGATDAPVPDYPAYASSRHPSAEEAKVEQPGYALSAESTETSSTAHARSGLAQDGGTAATAVATAKSTVDPGSKVATSSAASDTQPLTVNDVLQLGRVHSSASAKVGADGKVTRSSELTIGRTRVADQVVEITPEGVRAGGQTAPLPEGDPAEALEAAGVRVRYLAEQKSSRGVLSAGIEVVAKQQDAQSGAVYTAHYTFGRAFAAVAPVEDRAAAGSPPPAGTGSSGIPASSGTPAGASAGSGPSPSSADPGGVPEAAPAAPGSPEPAVAGPARLMGNPMDIGADGLYVVLVFGALAMFASGLLLRLLGVRTRWTG